MLVQFTTAPLDKGEHLSEYVSQALKLIDESGLQYKFTPMSTIVEGDWDDVLDLIKRCHHKLLENSNRVYTQIFIDDKKGKKGLMAQNRSIPDQ